MNIYATNRALVIDKTTEKEAIKEVTKILGDLKFSIQRNVYFLDRYVVIFNEVAKMNDLTLSNVKKNIQFSVVKMGYEIKNTSPSSVAKNVPVFATVTR